MRNLFKKANWVWKKENEIQINTYSDFRVTFEYTSGEMPDFYIACDSDYALWVNGNFIDCMAFDDWPEDKVADKIEGERFAPYLIQGKNNITVLAYYQGRGTFQYVPGDAGIIFELRTEDRVFAISDEAVCRENKSYINYEIPMITSQLGYMFEYNAQLESQGNWEKAKIQYGYKLPQTIRPIKKCIIQLPVTGKITAQGLVRRFGTGHSSNLIKSDYLSALHSRELFTEGVTDDVFSQTTEMDHDYIIKAETYQNADGFYILVDLKEEQAGLFTLEITAQTGTVVDIGYGQHVDDLRVRSAPGGRAFAARYICREGWQYFIHPFKRMGGRYIQLHIMGKGDVTLHYAGLRPFEYPLYQAWLDTKDALHNRIYEISCRTLKLCMHEHYEDTNWREQALYGLDSRLQMMFGYYAFGEYDFPESCLNLLSKSLRKNGYFDMCAPAVSLCIPSFGMAWVTAVSEFLRFSGRTEAVLNWKPVIDNWFSQIEKLSVNNLIPVYQGENIWHFYEWAEGLAGHFDEGNTPAFDAPFNAMYGIALLSAMYIAENTGDMQSYEKYQTTYMNLKEAYECFWDGKAYSTFIRGGAVSGIRSELTQALSLLAGFVPDEGAAGLRKLLSSDENQLVKITLSMYSFKMDALMQDLSYASVIQKDIETMWGHMIFSGATSLWETIKGADDFDYAGSLCHGWSAVPVQFYFRYVLGIYPEKPGFATYTEQRSGVLNQAHGEILTPTGRIMV